MGGILNVSQIASIGTSIERIGDSENNWIKLSDIPLETHAK